MADDVLRPGERIVAATELPGVAEATPGKVTIVQGLSWIRYWVRFDNGVNLGSIHRDKLARPKEYVALLEERARAAEAPAAPEDGGAGEGGGDGAEPAADEAAPAASGAASRVPAHLLERSRQARARA
jgi:hypothetical protein